MQERQWNWQEVVEQEWTQDYNSHFHKLLRFHELSTDYIDGR